MSSVHRTSDPSVTPATDDQPCSNNQEAGLVHHLGPVLLLTIIFFIMFVTRQISGPLLPAMEADLHLSHTQSGLFILFTGTGFFLSQISAAFLTSRWGYRRCILVSLWGTAAAAALVGWLNSVWALYLGFLALGLTGGLYVPSGIALITVLVRRQDWGKAMGIHELAPNLALILVPFLATLCVAAGSWRVGYFGVAAGLALLGMAYAWLGVDSPRRPSAPDVHLIREILTNPSFWCLGFLLSLAVGVETGVYSMVPLYLVNERAYDLADANRLLGLSRMPGLVMVLLSGWITDRLSPSTTITLALGVTGVAVIMMGIGPRFLLVTAIFVQAATTACLFPPILSIASQISKTENRALMLSLSLAVAPVIGGGLLPAGIALAGDLGSFSAGFAGAGILTTAGIGLVMLMNKRTK